MLGVIGGLGPLATAWFMESVIRMTDASCDQEHLDMIIYNSPHIPDRTSYILGTSKEDPVPGMVRIGRKLAEQGADCVAIPCITAHYFHRELTEAIPVKILDGVGAVGEELIKEGITKAGIMATDGTVKTGLFQERLSDMGIGTIVPEASYQSDVMDVIYGNIKAGKPVDMEKFHDVSAHLKERGAQAVILGCTELSLIKREEQIGAGYLDALEVLAQRAVLACKGRLKKEYERLLTE